MKNISMSDVCNSVVDSRRRYFPQIAHAIIIMILSLFLPACSISPYGYIPHDVYNINNIDVNSTETSPKYNQVRAWAFNVANAYDTRATLNRQALYGGELMAIAAATALVCLAAVAPESPAIQWLPIGATFLSGVMVIYNNEKKAVIYGYASQTIRDLMIRSDRRMVNTTDDKMVAACLHAEVSEVMQRVENHITLLDPKNVADQLKAEGVKVVEKQKEVDQAKVEQENAKNKADADPNDSKLKEAKKLADDNLNEAKKALEDLVSRAAANISPDDYNDLKKMPLCSNLAKENNTQNTIQQK